MSQSIRPNEWRLIEPLLDGVLDRPPHERAAFLREACEDTAIRQQVEELVSEHERGTPLLEAPAYERFARLLTQPVEERVPELLSGRYRIERALGRGGMATVYLAHDTRYERRKVAVKVLAAAVSVAVHRDRFISEVQTAARLSHPNIVPLYDSDESDGFLFYVMPFVEGESLRARLQAERPLPIPEALRIAAEVAEALRYAHAEGVVHRDIKPENILLASGRALVCDFGIALALAESGGQRLTHTGVVIGTPQYMSPEQATSDPLLDARSDIYSLGCVLYEMLAGQPPFTGATRQQVVAQHIAAPVPSLSIVRSTVSSQLEHVISTALAKVPADRHSTIDAFASAINGERERISSPTLSGASSHVSVTARRTALQRVLIIVVAGVAVLTLAVALWLVSHPVVNLRPAPIGSALDPRRMAILYFDDLSPEKNLGHVATGLTEDLIDRLSQVRSLSVVSPNGVRPYQGKTPPVDSLARVLKVGTIVSGDVTRAGTALRAKVRLIDGSTGQQMESWILDQSWEDQLTLQERLVAKMAVFVREHIDREVVASKQRTETKSVIAWETLRQAEDLLRRATAAIRTQRAQLANDLLQGADSLDARAMRLDRAWVAPIVHRGRVALAWSYLPSSTLSTDTTTEGWIRRAVRLADQALVLDQRSAEALALRGDARWRLTTGARAADADSLLTLAEADLAAALELRPDFARAWQALSEVYWWQARFSEAATASRRALDADAFLPNMASVLSMLFSASLESGRFDEAASWCRRGLQENPADPQLVDCPLVLLGYTGRGADQVASAWRQLTRTEAADSLHAMEITWGYRRVLVAAVLARTGMADSARAVLRRAHAEQARHPRSADVSLNEAYVHVLLGEQDEALRLLSRSLQSNRERTYAARSLWFRSLQNDPRFVALVRKSAG